VGSDVASDVPACVWGRSTSPGILDFECVGRKACRTGNDDESDEVGTAVAS
jgi:hypothetical protein